MANWWNHATGLGKVVVVVLLCRGVAAAVVVAYSLMGPGQQYEELAD